MLLKNFAPLLISLLVTLVQPSMAFAANGSGLPIPRFVTLKNDDINVRTGPGTRYPIQWVYHRTGMPVEVIEEYDVWRKIRDVEGTAGWVHKTMLDGKRNIMIKGKEAHVVRTEPEAKAKPLLKAEPMVTARLIECQPKWCRIQISGRKGWIEKDYLWGIYPDEIIE
jgi:SH3-like domain-containing protein